MLTKQKPVVFFFPLRGLDEKVCVFSVTEDFLCLILLLQCYLSRVPAERINISCPYVSLDLLAG